MGALEFLKGLAPSDAALLSIAALVEQVYAEHGALALKVLDDRCDIGVLAQAVMPWYGPNVRLEESARMFRKYPLEERVDASKWFLKRLLSALSELTGVIGCLVDAE